MSIKDTVVRLWNDNTFRKCIGTGSSVNIKDIKDGTVYKDNDYFKKNNTALAFQLYSDCVEVTNPLGAAKGTHKLLMMYVSILDFQLQYRSKIDSSFLVLVARYKEIKNSRELVFKKLIDDLKDLEAGIIIGEDVVKAGLLTYCGDNLECHEIGGFQKYFHAGHPCRFCLIPYKKLQELFPSVPYLPLWTKEKYDAIVKDIQQDNNHRSTEAEILHVEQYIADLEASKRVDEFEEDESEDDDEPDEDLIDGGEDENENEENQGRYGLRMACVFNELEAFHAVGSMANDIFHNLFEGGLSMDLMSTIRAMVAANLFSIEEINKKISTYPYGSSEKRDRLKENGEKR